MGGGTSKRKVRSIRRLNLQASPHLHIDIVTPMRSARIPSEDCLSQPFDEVIDEECMRSVFLTEDPVLDEEPNLLVQAEILKNRFDPPKLSFEYEKSRKGVKK